RASLEAWRAAVLVDRRLPRFLAHEDRERGPVRAFDVVMHVMKQQQPLAGPRVLERHPARIAAVGIGDDACGAMPREVVIAHGPQRSKSGGGQSFYAICHGQILSARTNSPVGGDDASRGLRSKPIAARRRAMTRRFILPARMLALAALMLLVPSAALADPADIDAASRGVVRVVIVEINGDQVVPVSHGTGFAVGPETVVTNAHVVAEA